ncbi:MAG: murein biosynthesis integral membrane protein MurJ [Thiohalocapsa sp.]
MASLAASLTKVGGSTLLSRVLGFVRDMIVAHVFGANAATDAFFVAFKIPNLMRRLFAEGAFSAAFVPVLHDYRRNRGFGALKRFVDDVAGTLGLVLLLITLLGVLAAPLLVLVFAPGFADDAGQRLLTSDMLRLVMPYLLFIGLTAFAGGILNTYERFGVPALTPVLLNLVLIGCALWLAPHMQQPIMALAWGVLIAGVAQLLFQLPFLARLGLLPRPRFAPHDPGVRRIGRLMLPALFGVSVAQLSLLIDTLLASFLTTGSISWLYYSDRLMEFPLGILGVAIGTVIMPRLARQHADGERAEPDRADAGADAPSVARTAGPMLGKTQTQDQGVAFSHTLDWGLRWVLLLGLPAAAGLFVLSGPMLAALFNSGAFGVHDVQMASRSLMAYSVGLVAFMAIKVLVPGFYSRHDVKTPVRIAAVAMGVNLVLSLGLMFPLGHAGLALATGIAALLNAGLLLRQLVLQRIYRPGARWLRLLAQTTGASLVMGAVLWFTGGSTLAWTELEQGTRLLRLGLLIGLGALLYGGALLALGLRPRHLR